MTYLYETSNGRKKKEHRENRTNEPGLFRSVKREVHESRDRIEDRR